MAHIDLETPKATDAAALKALIDQCPPLESNTTYAYLLFCTHFAEESLVARDKDGLVGAIVSYRPPTHPETVFVWQIGVHERARGTGLGLKMLNALADRLAPQGVTFLEATVTPSNSASDRLFHRFAENRGAAVLNTPHFEEHMFGDGDHEAENLYRIGPFTASKGEK